MSSTPSELFVATGGCVFAETFDPDQSSLLSFTISSPSLESIQLNSSFALLLMSDISDHFQHAYGVVRMHEHLRCLSITSYNNKSQRRLLQISRVQITVIFINTENAVRFAQGFASTISSFGFVGARSAAIATANQAPQVKIPCSITFSVDVGMNCSLHAATSTGEERSRSTYWTVDVVIGLSIGVFAGSIVCVILACFCVRKSKLDAPGSSVTTQESYYTIYYPAPPVDLQRMAHRVHNENLLLQDVSNVSRVPPPLPPRPHRKSVSLSADQHLMSLSSIHIG